MKPLEVEISVLEDFPRKEFLVTFKNLSKSDLYAIHNALDGEGKRSAVAKDLFSAYDKALDKVLPE